jgi:nitroreductase
MSFLDLAKKRYSCRDFKNDPVDQDKLEYILEAGRVAPSAKNAQAWHFIVVRERENLDQICSCYKKDWLKKAPCIIIICGDHDDAWRRPDGKDHTDIDVAIAVDHMTLAAADVGLSTCWVCNFDVMKCNDFLELPSQVEPVALLPLGYSNETKDPERHKRERKKLKDIVHPEKFIYKAFDI